ncbi:PQQ-dependent sugar dehydrogenase [Hydrogenophaga sp. OTU3427]|uniref:PQQ-dependent sugar dehydrogenase n=1 Tax=Hydrogenophaga sp. OTU3427 TaxID=3043856 RepID=UPI00313E4C1F
MAFNLAYSNLVNQCALALERAGRGDRLGRATNVNRRTTVLVNCVLASSALWGCGESATLSVKQGTGPRPELPMPRSALLPTVNIAPATGWPSGTMPQAAAGLQVRPFASGLDHPRWLLALPNGDVLVAESNAPRKPQSSMGIRDRLRALLMKRAGAGTPSADRISVLRDADGDGIVETRSVLLSGLHSPFGMALIGDRLFVANADAVLGFPYRSGDTVITAPGTKLLDLPGAPINHHWTKNLLASQDGRKLYVSVGSNSNIAERGLEVEAGRAAIWEVQVDSGAHRVFASGLRNPVGMAWDASGQVLWTVVNERDELGSDLVPDYLTAVKDGAFYGWPFSYFGQHLDPRVAQSQPALVATARVPDYALGPHTAPLGLARAEGGKLPPAFADGMFIGQHGSWNRRPHSGYKVIFVPFRNGTPAGPPLDVLTGFLSAAGEAMGRPVGVAIDTRGALLVADDVGNVIWRVSAQP